jgi:hypothetical protein
VPDRKPIWTAARLNEFVARFGDASVGFTPLGVVFRLGAWHVPFPGKSAYRILRTADLEHRANDGASAIADLYRDNSVGIETATTNLVRLPLLLAICAFDPAAWCAVVIHSGALEAAGPFRDVASPIQEWLLRAAIAGHSIGIHHAEWTELSVAPAPASGIISDDSLSTESALPELVPPGNSDRPAWLIEGLEASAGRRFGCVVKSEPDGTALSAGVWQMNGFLDQSHELAQSVEGKGKNRAGDYWHAIMHRREPDYSNAKYWLRRVGQHGIHPFLARDADDILATCGSADAPRWRSALTQKGREKWDAMSFVDLCEYIANGHDAELSHAARQIQLTEMALLLSSTYHDAVG